MNILLKFSVLFVALFHATTVTGLICWKCSNVISQKDCLTKGRAVRCSERDAACQTTLRHGGWGIYPMIEKTCKQRSACGSNFIQNSLPLLLNEAQCTMKPPSSVCRCCCTTDNCNQNLLCVNDEGMRNDGSCPKIRAPKYATMKCTKGMMAESECSFSCKRRFKLMGKPVVKCGMYSKWNAKPPICQLNRCKWIKQLQYGNRECTKGNTVGSRCSFSCNKGYTLQGTQSIKCIQYSRKNRNLSVTWSRMIPKCKG